MGLLDADIYGPSLPYLLEADDLTVRKSVINAKLVQPLSYSFSVKLNGKDTITNSLKMLSFGHVNPNAGVPGECFILTNSLVTFILRE